MSPELDNRLVEKYPKIFEMIKGTECNDGWYWLIDNLCKHIQSYIDNNLENTTQVVADQVKEKFGTLRVYYHGGDDYQYIDGFVSHTEFLSGKICEYCGSNKNIGYTKGWITTCCKECFEKEYKNRDLFSHVLNQRNWKQNEV